VGLGGAFDDILGAAQANSGWAFTRLHQWLAPAVSAYVRVQGVGDAEDVVSEVFLAAFTRIGTFQGGEAEFRSWVFTIAHHRIIDQRRAGARRLPTETLDRATDAVHAPSAEDVALPALELGRLRAVLDLLTPDQRNVLVLRVIADLSVDQVAEAVGKQPGAVRALQHRAVLHLRRALAAEAVTR